MARRKAREHPPRRARCWPGGSRPPTPADDGTQMQFRYYFAQREAVETVIWLYDVRGARDKFLLRFVRRARCRATCSMKTGHASWSRWPPARARPRCSLLMAWCCTSATKAQLNTGAQLPVDRAQHHRTRSPARRLSGLRILLQRPVLPDNGHAEQNWRDDFQVALHIQDEVRIVRPTRQHLPDQHSPCLSRRRARAVPR